MEEKKLKNIWLFSIFILLIAFSMYIIYLNKDESKIKVNTNKVNYEIVKNYNDFYTVNSCISRYMTYLYTKDTKSLLKVLDEEFLLNKNIDENNLYNNLNFTDANTFKALKMYEEEISKNVMKYYVYGCAIQEVMDELPICNNAYFIVLLDKNEGVFSIQPYTGDIFNR